MGGSTRRNALAGAAAIFLTRTADGAVIARHLPWRPAEVYPPVAAGPGGWLFFTTEEAAMVEAIVDRLIPADAQGPGGRDAGCAVFIDRQLSGPYGTNDGLYMEGPFPPDPLPTQGLQSPLSPREQYRTGLAALAAHCRATHAGRNFPQLSAAEQDMLLAAMEKGETQMPGYNARALFSAILANTMEGFFADPIYGGNRGFAGWKLVGFAGTRYDYRDVMANPNKRYTLPPVGLLGRG